MSRPSKCRKVCRMPHNTEFIPTNRISNEKVILSIDEYESIRLIDLEGFSQDECSSYMQVARSTVQQIYNSARKKIALALVEGVTLKIDGGNYVLCDGKESFCRCGGCYRHRMQNIINENKRG